MSKIFKAFENGKAFIAFITAGDPSKEKTVEFVLKMEEAGADAVELGIPFSDPIAEGEVIQNANIRALKNGMTTDGAFEIVTEIRKKSSIPLVFLTYLNPVFHYGYELFFQRCKEGGVDGIIIPDLPFEEKEEVDAVAKKYDVDLISLIAPTSEHRVKMIAQQARGFIYLVSSMGVTGVRNKITTDIKTMVRAAHEATETPVAVGFGISTPEQCAQVADCADGVIVGSAIVKLVEQYGEDAGDKIAQYVSQMKRAANSK